MRKCDLAGKLVAVIAAAAMCFGCMSVEYVGQSFPPLPADTPVVIFTPESPMPADEYRAIGRIWLTSPDGSGIGDVRAELIELARKHGAEAVNVVDCQRVEIGMGAADASDWRTPKWDRDDRNYGGAFIYSNSFGQPATLTEPRRKFYELQVKALLVVTNERFEAMEALYREQRAKLEAMEPDPEIVAGTPEQAMDQAVRSVDSSPAALPAESSTEAERKPTQLELNNSRNPVTL